MNTTEDLFYSRTFNFVSLSNSHELTALPSSHSAPEDSRLSCKWDYLYFWLLFLQ